MRPDIFEPGTVWLVGAGPGDPDLVTRKAAKLLAEADIVFHDALIHPGTLELACDAELVDVGKRAGRHAMRQDQISGLLLIAARQRLRVVRLKGGDPSIFGRSAEELDHLITHDVPVRVCPGITTASAAAASGLASLTLRGSARKLTFVTAHARAGESLDLDWATLAQTDTTLAIYMGRSAASDITRALIAAGRAPDTPVMIVTNVSMPNENLVRGRLDALGFLVRTISDDAPTLILVGEAVGARDLQANVRQRVQSR
jgi:uroporphyrin-III C-methyltransferase